MSKQLSLDVISDILSRLPAKSLLRFKCVSKPWCSLISSSDFITLHLKNSPNIRSNHSLILRSCDLLSVDLTTLDHAVVLDHPLKDSGGGTEVFGSCNGLLCLSNSEEEIAFWNFSTRKFRKLPVTQIEFPDYFTACQYIIYGFGYDSLNNDYKLVRIIQFFGEDYDSFDNEVKVYSLRANSWRRIADFPYYMKYKRAWGVLVNGALHWVVSRKPESDVENLIVAFHVGSEEWVEVPKPNFGDNDFHMNVGVLGGCLCVHCNYYEVRFDVWVMNEYGVESYWVKLFSIAQPKVIRSFEYIIPLVYSKNGREVLFNQDGVKFIRYDLKSGRVKNVRIRGVPDSFEVEVCVGSLVPLDGDGGIEGEQAKRKKKNRKRNKKKRDDFLPMGSKLVPEFPMEVIANILSRLPAKTLLRFKCVSKPWHTLIDGPDFVKMHLKQSIESSGNRSLILRSCYLYSINFDSFDKAIELNHPLKTPYYGTEVLGSCNGLLCLYNSEEDVVLWNPSTGKYQKIPDTPIQSPSDFAWCQYIIYGFGCDLINDDYKIVRIVQFYGVGDIPFDSEVKVYSLKRNSWRKIQKCPYYLRYKRGWGMFANGALHWVVTRRPDMDTSKIVVAFDLGIEQYREVPQPNFVDKSFHMNLAVLGGSLCILSNYHKVRVDIWVMKDYGVKESWTKLFSIAQPRVIRSFEYVRPVAYSNTGNEVLLEQDNKKLLWYDLKRDKVKNIKVHGVPDSFDAEICVGSLVALNGDTGIVGKKQQSQEKKKGKKRDDFLSEGFKLVL